MAKRRFRPNHEKVRSATQRRGRTTKPFMSSERLTISMRRGGCLATAASTLASLIARVGPDQFEPVEALADAVENQGGAVSVLDAGGMDDDPQGQALGVNQGVDPAPLHPLAGVITHCVCFTFLTTPFSADFSDWLSITPALGLASRPNRSRNAMRNSSQIASHAP